MYAAKRCPVAIKNIRSQVQSNAILGQEEDKLTSGKGLNRKVIVCECECEESS